VRAQKTGTNAESIDRGGLFYEIRMFLKDKNVGFEWGACGVLDLAIEFPNLRN